MAQLSSRERITLLATFSGWAVDGLDVMVYSFVIPTLIAEWHIDKAQAGILGTVALLFSAAGGWVAGILADFFGRALMLRITVIWFSVFTFLSGLTNSFWPLLVVRSLQGVGFGGEWAVGAVMMAEVIRAEHRGKAVGTLQSGWAIGWGAAAIAYVFLFRWLPVNLAWRAMFWIGLLPGLLVLYVRTKVREPEVFLATVRTRADQVDGFLEIFNPSILRTTVLASLMALGAQGGYYAITTWLPTYLRNQRGLSVIDTGAYLFVVIVGSFVGYLVSAYLADTLGRKPTLILFAFCCLLSVSAYSLLTGTDRITLVLGFVLGFFASGVFSPIGAFLAELFPTRVRGSGQGFCYNVGRALGALFPTLVGILSTRVPLGTAITGFAALAYLIMIGSVLLLPETRRKELG